MAFFSQNRTSLVAATAGVLLMLALSISFYQSHERLEREMVATFQEQQLAVARALASSFEFTLSAMVDETIALGEIAALFAEERREADAAQAFLNRRRQAHGGLLTGLAFVNAEGRVLLDSPPGYLLHPVSALPEFAEAVRTLEPTVGDRLHASGGVPRSMLYVIVPLSREGRFSGAVLGEVMLDDLWTKYLPRSSTAGQNSFWIVTDGDLLVYHSAEEYRLRTWEDIEHTWLASRGELSAEEKEEERLEVLLRDRVGRGETGSAWYKNNLEGVVELLAFSPIRVAGQLYGLAVVTPMLAIETPIHSSTRALVALTGLAVMVLAALAMLVFRETRMRLLLSAERQHAADLGESRQSLQKAHDYLQTVVDGIAAPVMVVARDHRVVLANRTACELSGIGDPVSKGLMCHRISHGSEAPCRGRDHVCPLAEVIATGRSATAEHVHIDPDGSKSIVEITGWPILDEDGEVAEMIEYCRDITERTRLEGQLRQSQKMQAIGQLTGGIAHDFNNILTALIGFADLAREALPDGTQAREDIEEVIESAERAAALTGQLLTFSRQRPLERSRLDFNRLIGDTMSLLRRSVEEHVEINFISGANLGLVHADGSQIQQILLNLAVNGRDAMPKGGRLTIETRCVTLNAAGAEALALRPGRYVQLSVSDTGVGMDEDTQARIFEPFFTTKEIGRGTGLGLSTVYGIVKQHGGTIEVDSEPGRGTTFAIILPQTEALPPAEVIDEHLSALAGGDETILLVEDEESVRIFTTRLLDQLGYRVIPVASPAGAGEVFENATHKIDLLLTDVVMPGLSGKELHTLLAKKDASLKVVYMSGYASSVIEGAGLELGEAQILHKPFRAESLSRAVRDALEDHADT